MYIRDPEGNPLAVYTRQGASGTVTLSEIPLYGSDRIGMIRPNIARTTSPIDTIDVPFTRYAGQRHYELKDHLGNVRAVITDELKEPSTGAFVANQVSRTDYYPFGMAMASRTQSQSSYRYGFNGKENDNEVKGEGNQQDYGFRIYDPRVARFLSVDPLSKDYPWNSTYAFAENDAVRAIDLEGLERLVVVHRLFGGSFRETRVRHSNEIQEKAATAQFLAMHSDIAGEIGKYERGGMNLTSIAGRIARNLRAEGVVDPGDARGENALRHSIWQAIISSKYGREISEQAGNAHEGVYSWQSIDFDWSLPVVDDKDVIDQLADALNNEIGRRIGEANRSMDVMSLSREVLKYAHENGVWSMTVHQDGTRGLSKQKLSMEAYMQGLEVIDQLDNNGMSESDRKELDAEK